ncbi:MAG: hypothetical protein HYX79_07595 [Chloroflexi bacterium]|nr:hypothetical protein [Chloroflexota bacterium]
MPRRVVMALVVTLLLSPVLAGAALAMSSASYLLPWGQFTGGSGPSASSSYRLDGTIGQRVVSMVVGTGQGYRFERRLLSGGGGIATSPGYLLNGTIGQPVTGVVTGEAYRLEAGFWTGSAAAPVIPPGQGYRFERRLLSGGGGTATSSGYLLNGTIGQPVTGIVTGEAYRLEAGFWTGSAAAPVIPPPGDANGDNSVNALDITKVERIIAGLDAQTPGADANGDSQFNAIDITKVERIIAGLD